jgi:hypothetical protein
MMLAILSRKNTPYSTQRLIAASRMRDPGTAAMHRTLGVCQPAIRR